MFIIQIEGVGAIPTLRSKVDMEEIEAEIGIARHS